MHSIGQLESRHRLLDKSMAVVESVNERLRSANLCFESEIIYILSVT
jgi:hypothetical protein